MRQVFCFVSDYKSSATLHSSVISQPLLLFNAIKTELYKLPRAILDGLFLKCCRIKEKSARKQLLASNPLPSPCLSGPQDSSHLTVQ